MFLIVIEIFFFRYGDFASTKTISLSFLNYYGIFCVKMTKKYYEGKTTSKKTFWEYFPYRKMVDMEV